MTVCFKNAISWPKPDFLTAIKYLSGRYTFPDCWIGIHTVIQKTIFRVIFWTNKSKSLVSFLSDVNMFIIIFLVAGCTDVTREKWYFRYLDSFSSSKPMIKNGKSDHSETISNQFLASKLIYRMIFDQFHFSIVTFVQFSHFVNFMLQYMFSFKFAGHTEVHFYLYRLTMSSSMKEMYLRRMGSDNFFNRFMDICILYTLQLYYYRIV